MAQQEITLKISTRVGKVAVPAKIDTRYPGLAVHRAFRNNGVRVTHAQSGLSIVRLRTMKAAWQAVKELAPLADWTQPADTFVESTEIQEVRKRYRGAR